MSYKKSLLVGLICLFSASCLFSCAKEKVYKGIVTVLQLDETGGVTQQIPVSDCKLVFGEENYDPEVRREVYTDVTGKYVGEWKREVALGIQASKEIDGEMYTGKSVLRLSLAATAEVKILIKKEQ